jgi:hypothetical protein
MRRCPPLLAETFRISISDPSLKDLEGHKPLTQNKKVKLLEIAWLTGFPDCGSPMATFSPTFEPSTGTLSYGSERAEIVHGGEADLLRNARIETTSYHCLGYGCIGPYILKYTQAYMLENLLFLGIACDEEQNEIKQQTGSPKHLHVKYHQTLGLQGPSLTVCPLILTALTRMELLYSEKI